MPDADAWIIDTPGIRSFGLAHVSAKEKIGYHFSLILGEVGLLKSY